MNLHASYFALSPALNPLYLADKWLNPLRHRRRVMLRGQPVEVRWTQRAERALQRRDAPLLAEMQLYFSCVVKKRVLFHEPGELEPVPVNAQLHITFRPVQSSSCDPVEFAAHYPVQQEFHSQAAAKMHPRWLQLDYKKGRFIGEFGL